jgi:pimeloyl-ACP methyl ester carboxylesterase
VSEMQVITVDGHRLCVEALNPGAAGDPLVLMHGVVSTSSFWGDDQTEALRANGPCFALSLPGHAPASFAPGFRAELLSAELIADLLATAIRGALGDRPVIAVGMSTGGFAALALAARHPQLVARVVCVSGFASGRWTGPFATLQRLARGGSFARARFRWWCGLVRSKWMLRQFWRGAAADQRALLAYSDLDAHLERTLPDYRRLDVEQVRLYFERMPDIDITSWLPRIEAPTLVIAGDRDPIVPPAQARLIAAAVPGAELVMLPGAGHVLFAERPAEYRHALDSWLRATASAQPLLSVL